MRILTHLAALICLAGFIVCIFGLNPLPPPPVSLKGGGVYQDRPEENIPLLIEGAVISAVGTTILLIDCWHRRKRGYTSSAMTMLFLVITGYPSGGLTSLLYYLFWGWRPLPPQAVYDFCPACEAASTSESAGNTFTFNFIYGTKLIGGAKACPICRSVIQTKLFMFAFLWIPLGSYRVIRTSGYTYISRRTSAYLPHMLLGLTLTATTVVLMICVITGRLPVR